MNIIFDIYMMDFFYQKGFFNEKNTNSNNSEFNLENSYYEILECDKNVTNEELKKLYKEQIKKYHPDKIQGKDLPKQFIELAENQIKEINKAYDYLKKIRNIQ